ncbi:uncharacterized protein LOC133904159 [Phragmites australis]|uniref:uncharacterized protein LOC133904159 n=1 Tax=Phragmites australis TaxID=29695 RepID=UPI002D78EE85|nr:uncharacterized protein LOC133904159 [Phragmites australis]
MDVYISEEYVVQRRAERRAARNAAAEASCSCEEKARADGGPKRWTAAWAEKGKRTGAGDGNGSASAGGGAGGLAKDVIFSYFSA